MKRISNHVFRRGQGALLVIVAVATGILLLIGLRQLFAASALTIHAARGSAGTTAALVAESAVQEGLWQFQKQANDPASPLFKALRREVYAPQPGTVSLDADIRPETSRELLRETHFRGFTLEDFEARVVYQRQFEDLPYERFGLVRFLARAAGKVPGGEAAVREVELARGFKVVLAGLPRPLDQAALFIGEASGVTDLTGVNSRRKRYIESAGRISALLELGARSAPADLASRYELIRKSILSREALVKSVPELPVHPGAILFAVWRQEQQFPLENLDLDRALQGDETRFLPDEAKLKGAENGLANAPSSRDSHVALLDAAGASLRNLSSLLGRIWAFHEGFRMVDSSEPLYAELVARQERLRLDRWRRVAFFRLAQGPGAKTCQRQLEELLARITPLSGVVLVENEREVLRLSGSLRGKLVIVTGKGGVTLDGTNRDDRPDDLLTVVSLGGSVAVAGEVRAAIALAAPVAGGEVGALTLQPGSVLKGSLVLERIAAGSQLAGRLVRASKFYSGVTGKGVSQRPLEAHYVVGVSPIGAYDRIGRR